MLKLNYYIIYYEFKYSIVKKTIANKTKFSQNIDLLS